MELEKRSEASSGVYHTYSLGSVHLCAAWMGFCCRLVYDAGYISGKYIKVPDGAAL